MKSLIYLAGAMNCYEDNDIYIEKAIKWREELRTCILEAADRFDTNTKFSFFDPTLTNSYCKDHKITHHNNYYLNKSGILVVNFEDLHKSIGTIYEIALAGLLGKPIIGFGHSEAIEHPHIKNSISCKLQTVSEVADYIVKFYGQ